jgi:lipopolysaccharide export LptBFGC system permease protein LptF
VETAVRLSTLDRYLSRRCTAAVLAVLVLVAPLILGLDLLLRLSDLLGGPLAADQSRLLLIGELVLLRLPSVLSPLLPLAAVAGALVALAPMLRRGELTALAAGGVSLRRSCRAAFILALGLGLSDVILSDLVAPQVQGRLATVESRLTGSSHRGRVWRVPETGSTWFADRIDVTAEGRIEGQGLIIATEKHLLQAQRLHHVPGAGWQLEGCTTSDGEAIHFEETLPCTGALRLPYAPNELAGVLASRYALSGFELWARGGHLNQSLALQRWLRLVIPLLCLACALPVFVRFENRSRLIPAASQSLVAAGIPLLVLAAGGAAADTARWSPALTLTVALALATLPAACWLRAWRQ